MAAPDISRSLVVVLLCNLAIIWHKSPQHLPSWGTVGKKDHLWKIFLWLQTITQLSFEAATCMRIGKAWALCDCLNVNLLFASENISITGNILLFRNWKFSKLAKWKNNKILRIFCKCQSCHFRYLVQGARSLITISDPAPLWPSVMNVWHVHSFVATHRNVYEHIQWNCLILVLGFIIFETHKYKWWRDRKYSIVCDLSR